MSDKKVYARQIPWEYQTSPLEFDDWSCYPIAVYGNRFYKEHISDQIQGIWTVLEQDELCDIIEEFTKYGEHSTYPNVTSAIMDYLAPQNGRKRYATQQIHALKKLVVDFAYVTKDTKNEILCDILSLVTGEPWDITIIRGYSQGDWQYVLYPSNRWDKEDIEVFEIEYFNKGSEWMVHDEKEPPEGPSDISGYCMYCYGYSEEEIAKEIAKEIGVDPSDVILYKYAGNVSVPKYEKVEIV